MRINRELAFYNPNARGTGGALKFEVIPADEYGNGYLLMTIAGQSPLDPNGGKSVYPRFDWSNAVCVKLDITETAQVLGVLRGESESLNDGNGLVSHGKNGETTTFRMCHIIKPHSGYSFEVIKHGTSISPNILLNSIGQGLALEVALESAIGIMAWG